MQLITLQNFNIQTLIFQLEMMIQRSDDSYNLMEIGMLNFRSVINCSCNGA